MNSNYLDFRAVQAEMDARYARRGRRGPRNSSLEVIRRTMSRAAREELSPNRPR
ncbi:hypothetical protein ACWEOW_05910 [Monashia sp. NPDC004114]